jgi:hypothetical protein
MPNHDPSNDGSAAAAVEHMNECSRRRKLLAFKARCGRATAAEIAELRELEGVQFVTPNFIVPASVGSSAWNRGIRREQIAGGPDA